MFDFNDVHATTKNEQVRAWAVEMAIDLGSGLELTDEELIARAVAIEKFVKEGA